MPEVRFYSGEDKINEEKRLKFKAEMDEAGLIRGERLEARAEGIAEGIAKGRAEGIIKGEELAIEKLIKKMRANGMSEEQIQKILNE